MNYPDRKEKHKAVKEFIAKIPPESSVTSTQNLLVYISSRKEFSDFEQIHPYGEYLLIDEDKNYKLNQSINDYALIDSKEGIKLYKR